MHKFKGISIGLDIGARFIKFVELKKAGDSIILSKFGIKEIPSDVRLDRDRVIMQTISQLFAEHKIKARKVHIAAGGQSVFIRFVKLLQIKQDKLTQTMRFEAQNQIPFPLNEVAWDWSLLGMDKKATRRAVIVAIKKNLVDEMVSKLNTLKLVPDIIDVSSVSLYNCMAFNEDYNEENLCAILDIGAKTSNLIIFRKDNIWIRAFPVALEKIEEAREEGVEELVNEIERSLEYYFMQTGEEIKGERKLDELILTGGGSMMEDIKVALSQRFNTSPRILDPFRKLKIPKDIFSRLQEKGMKNQLAVAVGLALRGIADLKIEVNFLKEMLTERYITSQRNLYTRLSIALAILIITIFSYFIRHNYSIKRLKLDNIDTMLETYRIYEPKIDRLQNEKDILKEKIDILYQTASSRDIWLMVFNTISKILPEDVWITDSSAILSLEKTGIGRLDLSGKALSYQSVNNFVSSLKSSPGFKDVKPISSSIETDKDTGEEIVKFSITMDVVVTEG